MKKKLFGFFTVVILSFYNVSAQETFKVMFYNLLNYPIEDAVPNREDDLEFILADYQPDLFLVCELNNSTGADNVLDITRTAINSNYEMATYVSNTSDDTSGNQNDLQNLLYYDSSKFILEEEIIVPTDLRDFNVYKVQLNTIDQTTNPIEIYIVVCHLKASSGPINEQRRFAMVQQLDNYLNSLPTDTNVLLGGDLNLYTATESAFQELLDSSNNITFSDPANRIGSWNNNSSFVDVFTQSTRTQSGLGGTTGGFDDRFDFILTSLNMMSTSNITYVADSYKVYGNNGVSSCYNSRINSLDCAGTEFSFEIRDALHNFSDHLPVTVSLQTDATLLSIDEQQFSSNFYLEKSVVRYRLSIYNTLPQLINKDIIICNSLGEIIKVFKLQSNIRQDYEVSDLSNGLYFLTVPNSNVEPLKFVVSN